MQPPKKKLGPNPENKKVVVEKPHIICGRNNVPVDPDRVFDLAAHGATDCEIAIAMGISDDTLRYHFADILSNGRQHMKDRLRRAQMRVAIETGNPTMLIWLGKNVLKQSDNPIATQETILPWSDED
jgi:hypothetical protein